MIKSTFIISIFSLFFWQIQSMKNNQNLTNFCIRNSYNGQQADTQSAKESMNDSNLNAFLESFTLQYKYMRANCDVIKDSEFSKRYGGLSKVLGKGTFGTVSKYCLEDSTLDDEEKCVAVKSFDDPDPQNLFLSAFKELNNSICIRTFLEEDDLERFGLIRKCHLVQRASDQQTQIVFVMQFFQTDLDQVIMAREQSYESWPTELVEKTVYEMYRLAQVMKALHRYGISHADLKPQNIFVDSEGRMKLGDFGASSSDSNVDKSIRGSPFFMDPELINREAWASSRRADIYALGVLYWAILTGKNYKTLIRQILKKGNFYKKIKELDSDLKFVPDIHAFQFPEKFEWIRTMLQFGIKRMSLKKVIGRLNGFVKKFRDNSDLSEPQSASTMKIKFNLDENKYDYVANFDLRLFEKDSKFIDHPLNYQKSVQDLVAQEAASQAETKPSVKRKSGKMNSRKAKFLSTSADRKFKSKRPITKINIQINKNTNIAEAIAPTSKDYLKLKILV